MNIHEIYPCTIIMDRYNGTYSGGKWTAWNMHEQDIPYEPSENDVSCAAFWDSYENGSIEFKNEYGEKVCIGLGNTPQEALEDLARRM